MSAKSNSRSRYAVLVVLVAVGLYARGAPGGARPARADFTAIAARHGYSGEEHSVTTEDGYVLTIFRIRRGKHCRGDVHGTPVYLMNGLLLSSDSWLDAGPAAGLGFLLADGCHDTWLGNSRGGTYGKRHRRLDPRSDDFWQFSADEVGYYDAPATVDYILDATGAGKLNYFGFSQGGSVALMMLSERPEYADKLGVILAAAPPTDLAHMTSSFGLLLRASDALEGVLARIGVYEALSTASVIQRLAERLCRFRIVRDTMCGGFFEIVDSSHPGSIAEETLETLYGHFPSGTSVRTMARYGQAMRSGKFQKYDFGERGNLKKYGSPQPPEYDLGAVTVPTVILQGASDTFVTLRDSERLASRLPRAELCVLGDPLWNHFDVVYSHKVNETLFPIINRYLLKYNT